ncbi:hypothetical protein [Hyphobacterium marinum]|uniref:Glycerophosphoryl diester phosphodiesterase membrane domain-containing protein n=1 Tax=Hyphobacterium marinum TaxID=3116574 RepID=A0ABU7M1F0_9PROT|nr:hypothetical protein [Hyphobacterium sp. Y6023]MEE2567644.1 hypothetical protein [Hyphobacterium sp. Y6023]
MAETRFHIAAAAFRFFIVAKRNPLGFLWLTIWSVVPVIVLYGGLLILMVPLAAQDSAEHTQTMIRVFTWVPLIVIGSIIFFLSLATAWIRFLLHGRNKPVIPIRLGADEGRVFVTGLVVTVVMWAVQFALIIPVMIVAASVGLFTDQAGQAASDAAMIVLIMAMYGPMIAVTLYFSVRLYPAFGLSVLERRIFTFDAWPASKGVYWPALGAVILSWIVVLVIYVALLGLAFLPLAVDGYADSQAEALSSGSLIGFIGVFEAIMIVVGCIMMVWMSAIPFGPIAYIAERHHQLKAMADVMPAATPSDG